MHLPKRFSNRFGVNSKMPSLGKVLTLKQANEFKWRCEFDMETFISKPSSAGPTRKTSLVQIFPSPHRGFHPPGPNPNKQRRHAVPTMWFLWSLEIWYVFGWFLDSLIFTRPETSIAPKSVWLEYDPFLLGARPIFRGELLVWGRVVSRCWFQKWGFVWIPNLKNQAL